MNDTTYIDPENSHSNWENWNYEEWNDRLINYCFAGDSAYGENTVARIPSTPEELAEVVGEKIENSEKVVHAFIKCMNEQLPSNIVSLCRFCSSYGSWSPNSNEVPHFFAMLWLTCLIAYGYPDSEGGFNERVGKTFGRTQQLNCLPKLWSDLEKWTNNVAKKSSGTIRRSLRLPPDELFLILIGSSWFLAFPHQHDRRKLFNLLYENDLIGDEPPISPVIELLERNQYIFSKFFREDLENFRHNIIEKGADARNSAFWRAVRQECFSKTDDISDQKNFSELGLFALRNDQEELVVYVAATENALIPESFTTSSLPISLNEFSKFLLYSKDPSKSPSLAQATIEVFDESITIPTVTKYIRRGVLVFKEVLSGEYGIVGGAEANHADIALVREDKSDAFVNAYGGSVYPSQIDGWIEIVDCNVIIEKDLPIGLEGVFHLQETMIPRSIYLVGGIRIGNAFYSLPNFLPKVRFKGAETVKIYDSQDILVGSAKKDFSQEQDWVIPNGLVELSPGAFVVRVTWLNESNNLRTTETRLILLKDQIRHDYKYLSAGKYIFESCSPFESTITDDQNVPIAIESRAFSDSGPDLIELDSTAKYLGPGCGEISRTKRNGFDWLVINPKNRPNLLLFIGNTSSPNLPENRISENKGDRRFWRKAFRNSDVTNVRLSRGRIASVDEIPTVSQVLDRYRKHDPNETNTFSNDEHVENFNINWEGIEPDRKVSYLQDAVAALSIRSGGLRQKVLLELLSDTVESSINENRGLIFDLMRGWQEAGLLDIAYSKRAAASFALARRPFFVAFRIADRIHASLLGLVPSLLQKQVKRTTEKYGGTWTELLPPCKWLPKIIRVECRDRTILQKITKDAALEPPGWVKWPVAFDLQPDSQKLFDDPPHESFLPKAIWNWDIGKFIKISTDPTYKISDGVNVELRSHPQRPSIFVVLLDGEVMAWTHIRNWALLYAYSLRDGYSPYEMKIGNSISRSGGNGIYLPLPLGRLCAILGEGLSGPKLDEKEKVKEYCYPLGATYRNALRHLIPIRKDL